LLETKNSALDMAGYGQRRSRLMMLAVEHAGQNEHDQGQGPASQGKIRVSNLPDRDMAHFSTPNLEILLSLEYNVARTVARKGGGEPADRNVRLSQRVDLLTRLTLHAIGRLSMSARA
jgi:hypothetical protein